MRSEFRSFSGCVIDPANEGRAPTMLGNQYALGTNKPYCELGIKDKKYV
jgi:hypothetical protein